MKESSHITTNHQSKDEEYNDFSLQYGIFPPFFCRRGGKASMSVTEPIPGFLLTRQWRDFQGRVELSFWFSTDEGPVRVMMEGQDAICFIARDQDHTPALDAHPIQRRHLKLRTLGDAPVDGLYFKQLRHLKATRDRLTRQGVELFETDVKPHDRYLMERFITGGATIAGVPLQRDGFTEYRSPKLTRSAYKPTLKQVAIDIETDGLDGALYSIAVATPDEGVVFMAAAPGPSPCDPSIVWCDHEAGALRAFFGWLQAFDPDLILGWNVAGFDLEVIERKCRKHGLPFAIARALEPATVLQPQEGRGMAIARVPGRVVLDGIELLRAGFWAFESFELEVVARELLGRGKAIETPSQRVDEINRMFREDPSALAAYNLEDCRLVLDIFAKANLLEFARERAEVTGLSMDRYGGSVAAFDHLYLPRLHRAGRVAPDVGSAEGGLTSPGGYVLDSKPGLHDHVLLLDFKSLYPSIIRTFQIDPLALAEAGNDAIPGFDGAVFSRDHAILPDLVRDLWQVRDRAKAEGDGALSQAVKILMNSLYGVLGTSGCRFLDSRLTASITKRGHEIILESKREIERQGHDVIYGDTDSLFIRPQNAVAESLACETGQSLSDHLNNWWRDRILEEHRLTSYLEVEFETHFLKFFMPTIRGAETGSKKRYAGLIRLPDGSMSLTFKGLESVRTDWTPLAKRFQRELYRRIFLDEPFEAYIRDTVASLHAGSLDDELVYRKRLRRGLQEYKKSLPPHVQAAKKLDKPGRWIRYVITPHGPEPVLDRLPKPDYDHYQQKQLMPIADAILGFVGTSFEAIAGKQLTFF